MRIFVVPYRNRPAQLRVFLSHMKYLLEDIPADQYKIYIMNQADHRPFNRGGMRNLGFLRAKEEFPDTYREIDFIFHDLDNLIGEKNLVHFTTKRGEVDHIFGSYENRNVGGIWVIKGGDFEKINGYPNFWGWGYEDDMVAFRIEEENLILKRNTFKFHSKAVVHLDFCPEQVAERKMVNPINKKISAEKKRTYRKFPDGLRTLKNIKMNKEQLGSRVEQWNVTSFSAQLSSVLTEEKEIWILAPHFATWIKNNLGKFKISEISSRGRRE